MTDSESASSPDDWPEDWPDEWWADLKPGEPHELTRGFGPDERNEWPFAWWLRAHRGQRPPPGDWSVWLIMAGRGFGKTRAGAEWVRLVAETNPAARIALVAATLAEARSVMVEGESGILACSPPHRRPGFEPSLRRLTWPAGAQATLYSALEAESLRGPQHSHARRAGAEGDLRQRSPCAGRCPAAPRDRGRGCIAARSPGRWRDLAGRDFGHGRLGRRGRQARLPAGRQLAVRRAARRHAAPGPVDRSGAPFLWNMANCRRTPGTKWRVGR